ncbi:MAG: alpha/beta hydrolase [Syntrophorhabdaceae bacterium]|nr:alpha/beta hydrolase [Syntrophorhabdaceae bacterium]
MKRLNVKLPLLVIASIAAAIMLLPVSGFSAVEIPACDPPGDPIIWGAGNPGAMDGAGYCKNQIDFVYLQGNWSGQPPNTSLRGSTLRSELAANYPAPDRFEYGSAGDQYNERQYLLLYRSLNQAKSPILVYIHGGSWQSGSAENSVTGADMFMEAGAHYIPLNFVNVTQTTNMSIMAMANQIRKAIVWVYNNAESFNGDKNKIYISGHSSGGHLCGAMMTTDWASLGVPANVIKGGLCSSGMYDLTPVSLSYRNTFVDFALDDTVNKLSAIKNLQYLVSPIHIIYGTGDTPEFQRQSRDFVTAAEAAGKKVTHRVGYGYDHFELPETMGNPYGVLGRAALEMMDLQPSKYGKRDCKCLESSLARFNDGSCITKANGQPLFPAICAARQAELKACTDSCK